MRSRDQLGRRGCWRWCAIVAALICGVHLGARQGRADPLDKITGTEGWKGTDGIDREAEWEKWYRARVHWRRSARELLLQRTRNLQLAELGRSRRRPSKGAVRKILTAPPRRLKPVPVAPGYRAGSAGWIVGEGKPPTRVRRRPKPRSRQPAPKRGGALGRQPGGQSRDVTVEDVPIEDLGSESSSVKEVH